MFNLLSANFYRLFKSKEFLVLLTLYPILTVLTQITGNFSLAEVQDGITLCKAGINSWFVITLAALIISNFIAEEFMLGPMFYRVGGRYGRNKVYMSYWISAALIMFVFLGVQGITAFITGLATCGIGDLTSALIYQVLMALLFGLVYSSLFVMTAFIIKKSIPAMVANSVMAIILAAVLPYASASLNADSLGKIWVSGYVQGISTMSLSAAQSLVPIAMSIIYISAFCLIGLLCFRRQDID